MSSAQLLKTDMRYATGYDNEGKPIIIAPASIYDELMTATNPVTVNAGSYFTCDMFTPPADQDRMLLPLWDVTIVNNHATDVVSFRSPLDFINEFWLYFNNTELLHLKDPEE